MMLILRRTVIRFNVVFFQSCVEDFWWSLDILCAGFKLILQPTKEWHTTVKTFRCKMRAIELYPCLLRRENLTWIQQFVGPVWSFSLAQNRTDRKRSIDCSINACRHVSLWNFQLSKRLGIVQKWRQHPTLGARTRRLLFPHPSPYPWLTSFLDDPFWFLVPELWTDFSGKCVRFKQHDIAH